MTRKNQNMLIGLPVLAGLIAVALLSAPTTVQAQEVVLTACYVPDVGVVYRIKAAGLPDVCTETTHVEFSWNMEGPAGPSGPAGPAGPSGSTPVVFAGECITDAFADPQFGDLTHGAVITDGRFTINDPPAHLTVWEGEAAFPGFLSISDGYGVYYLENGRLLLTCFGDSYVAHVSF